ncbi:hypothetical protein H2200_001353 [Cladophialophora chaetospira]|uniref:DUF7791 domain-containing protein n=1 Tax=Cladophialophora chaetospira TaxID=386627 RepID=A0AA39CMY8_9EURO|nr:hypothetical protein H2200_001353 [Cladophialophora chaetospira]
MAVMNVYDKWYLGTPEQKSQEGLHRALLYNFLAPARSLIPELLPRMWKEVYSSDETVSQPSEAEVKQAFKSLGRHESYLTDANSNIKMVISSRPLPICIRAFSTCPGLRLQDLTRGDIRTYVRDKIHTHDYMILLCRSQPQVLEEIVKEMVEKSSGVFLWVVLACRSVQDGLDNFDSLSEIKARINELPPELEDLFRHILGKIEKRYRRQAAKYLRLLYCSRIDQSHQPLAALGLAIVAENDLKVGAFQPVKGLSQEERQLKCKMLDGKLRSRTLGLLELRPRWYTDISESDCECLCSPDLEVENHDPLVHSVVDFMHLTVFEFLRTPGVLNLEIFDPEDETFDAHQVLSYVSLNMLELSGPKYSIDSAVYFEETMSYLRQASTLGPQERLQILSGIVKQFDSLRRASDTISNERFHVGIFLAVETGMVDVVQNYVKLNHGLRGTTSALGFPLLYHATRRPVVSKLKRPPPLECKMISYLLEQGANPNEPFQLDAHSTTPWESWTWSLKCLRFRKPKLLTELEVTRLMVDSGAEIMRMSRLPHRFGNHSECLLNRVEDFFGEFITWDPNSSNEIRTRQSLLKLIDSIKSREGYNLDPNRRKEKDLGTPLKEDDQPPY